jgi:hypothetical protein
LLLLLLLLLVVVEVVLGPWPTVEALAPPVWGKRHRSICRLVAATVDVNDADMFLDGWGLCWGRGQQRKLWHHLTGLEKKHSK